MKTELKEISQTQKQIDIEIDADAVRKIYDRISDQYAKAATVPGFRPVTRRAPWCALDSKIRLGRNSCGK
jgi:hypothetical protein